MLNTFLLEITERARHSAAGCIRICDRACVAHLMCFGSMRRRSAYREERFYKPSQPRVYRHQSGYAHPLYRNPMFHYPALAIDYSRYADLCPASEQACNEAVWLEHRLLLGDEEDMDDIARAVDAFTRIARSCDEVCLFARDGRRRGFKRSAKVGEFRAEVQHTFGMSNGLPSNDVRCVAAAGARVWAGTAQGIAVREASPVVDRRAVDACASGTRKYFGSRLARFIEDPLALRRYHARPEWRML